MPKPKPFAVLVIPDDEPPVLHGSHLEPRVRGLSENVEWYFDRPASEEETIYRVKGAEAVLNTRASFSFSRRVLAACPKLKILSVWRAGVDHVDLGAAAELGITVTNTPVTPLLMCRSTPWLWPWPCPGAY